MDKLKIKMYALHVPVLVIEGFSQQLMQLTRSIIDLSVNKSEEFLVTCIISWSYFLNFEVIAICFINILLTFFTYLIT